MSDKPVSVFDGCRFLCADQLKGKRFKVTIASFKPAIIKGDGGREASGFEVGLKETDKIVAFTCVTNRKKLNEIFGTDDYTQYIGKRVCLWAEKTSRGLGIRFAAEGGEV